VGDEAFILTTYTGRVLRAGAGAAGLLNCPQHLLRGSFFPAFMRQPRGASLLDRMRRAGDAFAEWPAMVKPLASPPRQMSVRLCRAAAVGSRRNLFWELREPEAARREASSLGASSLDEALRRVGRELHDEVGQVLAAVHLTLDAPGCTPECPGRRQIERARHELDQAENQLRRVAHALHPAILDDLGLVPALEALARTATLRSGVSVEVAWDEGPRLGPETELHLYRIAQEALANVQRHAGASRARVRLRRAAATAVLTVEDDGRGFALGDAGGRAGIGLLTMAERARLMGGEFRVASRAGHGTELSVVAPLRNGSACAS
jgi:signal transduction histidine kinase